MSLHLWEAGHEANTRSEPLFDIELDDTTPAPPSLPRVLLAAATLWCRTMTWPSEREIASTAAVAASTSIRVAGSSDELRALVVISEQRTIRNLAVAHDDGLIRPSTALWLAISWRVDRLTAIDPAPGALPALAGAVLDDRALQIMGMVAFAHDLLDDLVEMSEVA